MTKETDEHNAKVLNAIDRRARVVELLRSYGASEKQAEVGASAMLEKFTWTGTVLNFNASGLSAVDDPAVKEYVATEYPFLLPTKAETEANAAGVDPAVLASARAGNRTAYGKVYLALGKDRAATDALIAQKQAPVTVKDDSAADDASDKKPITDHSKNPWHKSNFNVTRQGQLLKQFGKEKAASMAKSVGSHIGATHPNLDF
jgi:hypothetical protein